MHWKERSMRAVHAQTKDRIHCLKCLGEMYNSILRFFFWNCLLSPDTWLVLERKQLLILSPVCLLLWMAGIARSDVEAIETWSYLISNAGKISAVIVCWLDYWTHVFISGVPVLGLWLPPGCLAQSWKPWIVYAPKESLIKCAWKSEDIYSREALELWCGDVLLN